MRVPFLDLKAQYEQIKDEVDLSIAQVVDSCAFAGGKFVATFEEQFADYCGTRFAVGVGSGTEALWFALLAHGIGPGDEVVTVPHTFIATVEAISFTGATPVFVDIREDTALMDPRLLEAAITPQTRAIIPVHLYGQMADMDPIHEIAKRHGIPVIEDAAQAHGARYGDRQAGSIGDAGCFSFYPGKNLGAYGEAGAITTNDEGLAQSIRELRDHGQSSKYHHDIVGWNGRMDGIQGAVLAVKLKYLDEWNAARRAHADLYRSLINGHPTLQLLASAPKREHVYHLFVVRTGQRATVMSGLKERDIACGIHYPEPAHLTTAYSSLGLPRGAFPRAEAVADEVLSLPMYAELGNDQIHAVANALIETVVQPA